MLVSVMLSLVMLSVMLPVPIEPLGTIHVNVCLHDKKMDEPTSENLSLTALWFQSGKAFFLRRSRW